MPREPLAKIANALEVKTTRLYGKTDNKKQEPVCHRLDFAKNFQYKKRERSIGRETILMSITKNRDVKRQVV